jgi:hypothetical protein
VAFKLSVSGGGMRDPRAGKASTSWVVSPGRSLARSPARVAARRRRPRWAAPAPPKSTTTLVPLSPSLCPPSSPGPGAVCGPQRTRGIAGATARGREEGRGHAPRASLPAGPGIAPAAGAATMPCQAAAQLRPGALSTAGRPPLTRDLGHVLPLARGRPPGVAATASSSCLSAPAVPGSGTGTGFVLDDGARESTTRPMGRHVMDGDGRQRQRHEQGKAQLGGWMDGLSSGRAPSRAKGRPSSNASRPDPCPGPPITLCLFRGGPGQCPQWKGRPKPNGKRRQGRGSLRFSGGHPGHPWSPANAVCQARVPLSLGDRPATTTHLRSRVPASLRGNTREMWKKELLGATSSRFCSLTISSGTSRTAKSRRRIDPRMTRSRPVRKFSVLGGLPLFPAFPSPLDDDLSRWPLFVFRTTAP